MTVDPTTGEETVTAPGEPLPPIEQEGGTPLVPAGLEGEDLDAWVSGDVVEGDEQNNPERWAAYQERVAAAEAYRADQQDGTSQS